MLIITGSLVDSHVALQIIRMISPAHYVVWHAWPVVAGMDFKVKLAMIRSLASAYHDDETGRDYIIECCDELQWFYQKRNLVAHGVCHGIATKDGRHSFMMMMPDNKRGGMKPPSLVKPAERIGAVCYLHGQMNWTSHSLISATRAIPQPKTMQQTQHDLATRIICADSCLKFPAPVLLRPIAIGGSIRPLVVIGHRSKYQVHQILIRGEPQAAYRRTAPRAADSQRAANSLLYMLDQRPWSD